MPSLQSGPARVRRGFAKAHVIPRRCCEPEVSSASQRPEKPSQAVRPEMALKQKGSESDFHRLPFNPVWWAQCNSCGIGTRQLWPLLASAV